MVKDLPAGKRREGLLRQPFPPYKKNKPSRGNRVPKSRLPIKIYEEPIIQAKTPKNWKYHPKNRKNRKTGFHNEIHEKHEKSSKTAFWAPKSEISSENTMFWVGTPRRGVLAISSWKIPEKGKNERDGSGIQKLRKNPQIRWKRQKNEKIGLKTPKKSIFRPFFDFWSPKITSVRGKLNPIFHYGRRGAPSLPHCIAGI